MSSLPIQEALPRLVAALAAHRSVVLEAPPGAGKSTGVPIALLGEPWLAKKKIIMLEPRRIAARSVAQRMAATLKESVGATVGYRTRLDTKVSGATRIEVVTEGILTRQLQHDPALEDAALVIFDEFHERSLQADLGLALCIDVQQQLRDDLKILVMSATLDGAAVARLLHDAPVVSSEGRSFPVETVYLGRGAWGAGPGQDSEVARTTVSAILRALKEQTGDMLVFLPGQGEIHRVQRLLEEASLPKSIQLRPLYGELSPADQDAALKPSESGDRKVVLTTNIAETSLTIEGVRIVIDSGVARRSRFDPATGMSRLDTVRISRASADQRRGRAGRVAAGVCYRLWTESEHSALAAFTPAEIVEADLAPLALDLASWGAQSPDALHWLDVPPTATFSQARDLLKALGALDATGKITGHGRAMNGLGMHPRLAHMLLKAHAVHQAPTAALIAALLSERDIFRYRSGQARDVDIRLRVEAVQGETAPRDVEVDRGARQRVRKSADQFLQRLDKRAASARSDVEIGPLLAWAFPDRIGQSRGAGGRYLLANGRGAVLLEPQNLAKSEFLVVAELDDADRDARIRLAAPLSLAEIESHFEAEIEEKRRVEWNVREQIVVAQTERTLGALVLSARRIEKPDADSVSRAMLEGVAAMGIESLPWTPEARSLQSRIEFLRRVDTGAPEPWPAVDAANLLLDLESWLGPWLNGVSRRDHLARIDVRETLLALLNWNQRTRLDEFAPTHLTVPSGSNIPIDYSNDPPTLAVRLQEIFGLTETPRVGGGKVSLLLQLLSPARRPVQTTQDLASFWARGYHDVKKDLKGRYPKHYWPDDPLQAQATARAKPRR